MFRWMVPLLQGGVLFIVCAPLVIGSSTLLGQITGSAGAALVVLAGIAAAGTAGATLITGRPILLAPHMGLTALCCFNLYWGNGFSYPEILTIVTVGGGILVLFSVTGLVGRIVMAVPPVLVAAMGAAVGLALAAVGLRYAGIVVTHPVSAVTLGSLAARVPVVVGIGFAASVVAYARGHKYYLEIGAVGSFIAALCLGLATAPEFMVSLTPFTELSLLHTKVDIAMLEQWDRVLSLLLFLLVDALAMLVTLRECFSLSEQKINQVMTLNGACLIVSAVLGAPGVSLVPESLLARAYPDRAPAIGLRVVVFLLVGSAVPGLIAYFGNGLDFGGTGLQYPLVASTLFLGGLTCVTALRAVDFDNREAITTVGTVVLLAVFSGSISTAFVGGLAAITLYRTAMGNARTVPLWCLLTLGMGLIWRLIS